MSYNKKMQWIWDAWPVDTKQEAQEEREWRAEVAAAKKEAADPTNPRTIRRAREDAEYRENEEAIAFEKRVADKARRMVGKGKYIGRVALQEARDALEAGEKTCVHGGVDVVMSTGAARSQLECMRDLLCL